MGEIYAAGIDPGTMHIKTARDNGKGEVAYNEIRNCYREMLYDPEFEDQLKNQRCQYIRDDDKLYVIGGQAYVQAGMAEVSIGLKPGETSEMLKRPMKDGILNPESPKISMLIMRELMRGLLEKDVGKARPGEILYFSVPANPVDSNINRIFHEKMAQKYLEGLGYDSRPICEALALVYSENPKMHSPEGSIPFTGMAISFGSGMTNFCLAERGLPMDEFSVCRGGDYIDANVARMVGQPTTKVIRIKERELDFNTIDDSNDIHLALECYYDELIQYVLGTFAKRFSSSKGSIPYPIDVVVSGGTACPGGFDKKIRKALSKIGLPFEIKEVRLAGGGDPRKMIQAVAKGCYARAKQAAKKATADNAKPEASKPVPQENKDDPLGI